jgi:hypothetical protein
VIKGRDPLGEIDLERRIILKFILKIMCGLDMWFRASFTVGCF